MSPAAPALDAGLDFFNIVDLGLEDDQIDPIRFMLEIPEGWTQVEAHYLIRMPGFILETGQAFPANGIIEVVYDPLRLKPDFPNIDLRRRQNLDRGLADEVIITVYLSGRDGSGTPTQAAKMLTLVGEDVYDMSDDAGVAAFKINAGLNDAWYNPLTDGQGIFVIVYPSIPLMFVAWFTYEVEAPSDALAALLQRADNPAAALTAALGDDDHRWLTAAGPYEDDRALLDVSITRGGKFDAGDPVMRETDGTIELIFEDCSSGVVKYNIPSIGRTGEVPIQRVANDNVALCEELSSQ